MNGPSQGHSSTHSQGLNAVGTLRAGGGVVTYIQIWEVAGTEAQERWMQIMQENVHTLQAKPGFVTLTLHRSLDGNRIAVYAQWTSPEALNAAITDRQAMAAHDRMAQIGTSDGTLYTVDRVYGPIA